jgi:hypothetical protein
VTGGFDENKPTRKPFTSPRLTVWLRNPAPGTALTKSTTNRSGPVKTLTCGRMRSLASISISTWPRPPSTCTRRIDGTAWHAAGKGKHIAAHTTKPAAALRERFMIFLKDDCVKKMIASKDVQRR